MMPLLLAAAVALSPPDDPNTIATAWIVQADSTQTGERSVMDGGYVLKQRLLPPTLIELREDVRDAKTGKTLARAGEQLFGLLTRGPPVFCVNAVPKASLARSLLLGSGNLQRCLIDQDADGRLDGYFNAGNAIPGLPNFRRGRPKRPSGASGGRYAAVDPGQDRQNWFVGIRYEGTAGLLNQRPAPVFSIRFGTEDNPGRVTADTLSSDRTTPFAVGALGARFTVLAIEGSTIRVQIERPMPEQPFGVVQTISYR